MSDKEGPAKFVLGHEGIPKTVISINEKLITFNIRPSNFPLTEINAALQPLISRDALAGEFIDYVWHDDDCILAHCSAGEPTPDGGYRNLYAGKWYQTRPKDESPKCQCGLSELLAKFDSLKGDVT